MKLCVTVEGSPRVNALPSSSSSTWPEMSHKSNPVSLLPHRISGLEIFQIQMDILLKDIPSLFRMLTSLE
jgi:hypothetical protein